MSFWPRTIIQFPQKKQVEPDGVVWNNYQFSWPQQDLPIIIKVNPEFGGSGCCEKVVVPRDFPSDMNICGLKWRPTGIFQELGGKITQAGYRQINANSYLNSIFGNGDGLNYVDPMYLESQYGGIK